MKAAALTPPKLSLISQPRQRPGERRESHRHLRSTVKFYKLARKVLRLRRLWLRSNVVQPLRFNSINRTSPRPRYLSAFLHYIGRWHCVRLGEDAGPRGGRWVCPGPWPPRARALPFGRNAVSTHRLGSLALSHLHSLLTLKRISSFGNVSVTRKRLLLHSWV